MGDQTDDKCGDGCEYCGYGDYEIEAQIMTISEFLEQVELGCYNEYDGSGYLGTETTESNIPVWSALYSLDQYPEYTHVHWYNK